MFAWLWWQGGKHPCLLNEGVKAVLVLAEREFHPQVMPRHHEGSTERDLFVGLLHLIGCFLPIGDGFGEASPLSDLGGCRGHFRRRLGEGGYASVSVLVEGVLADVA